jgi:hypothetical protein
MNVHGVEYLSDQFANDVKQSERTPIKDLKPGYVKSTSFLEENGIQYVEQFASMTDKEYDNFISTTNSSLQRTLSVLRDASKLFVFERAKEDLPRAHKIEILNPIAVKVETNQETSTQFSNNIKGTL